MAARYTPKKDRYEQVPYRQCGRWGLKLPAISLGCWHNFGGSANNENAKKILFTALDNGITHFDLANNYGPPPGSAETRVGKILKMMPRDELIISTKAGFLMWDGPYGEWGSRKYLLASLDQSLKRLGLEYVDIFYHHRPDMNTPLDETMSALDTAVRQGKALYAGISNYRGDRTNDAACVSFSNRFAPLLIHQARYNMLDRWVETDLLHVVERHGIGVIAFCPLAQGVLTDKYLKGVPRTSRAAGPSVFLKKDNLKPELLDKVRKLNDHAKQRGQTLAQMALAWVLRDPRVTSALIGASRPQQIKENVAALKQPDFAADELAIINAILAG